MRQRGTEVQEGWQWGGSAPWTRWRVPKYSPNLSGLTPRVCVCVCYSLQCLCRLCQPSWRVRTPNYPSGEAEPCQALVPGAMLPPNPQRLQRPCWLLWPQFHLLQRLLPPPARPQCTGRSHVLLSRAAGDGTSAIPCLSPTWPVDSRAAHEDPLPAAS